MDEEGIASPRRRAGEAEPTGSHITSEVPTVPIPVTCSSCNARTKAPDAAAGRKAKCPKCGSSVAVPALEPLPDEEESRALSADPTPRHSRRKLLLASVVTLLLLCGGGYLAWAKVTENRQKARAEEAVRSALDRWCSKESWEKLRTGDMGDSFGEFISNTSNAPRPTGYEIGDVARGKHGSYVVAVTLKFLGGPETRLYEVTFSDKSGRSHISTKASEDVSNTEGHARAVLQSWLDSWAAGEELATFKSKHPEAAGQLTMDVAWATHSSKGKRLVRYEIGAGTPTRNGFKFTVEAMLEDRGTPETEIIYYEVFKDRTLSGGRWTITGTSGG